jgi:hypothetical protein
MDFDHSGLLLAMQEKWNFEIAQETEMITAQTIEHLIQEKRKELEIFLSYYFKKEGAIVEHVSLSSSIEFIALNKGKFTLKFHLIHFNACLAIHDQKSDELEIVFEFDSKSKNLTLSPPFRLDRGMDEI